MTLPVRINTAPGPINAQFSPDRSAAGRRWANGGLNG